MTTATLEAKAPSSADARGLADSSLGQVQPGHGRDAAEPAGLGASFGTNRGELPVRISPEKQTLGCQPFEPADDSALRHFGGTGWAAQALRRH